MSRHNVAYKPGGSIAKPLEMSLKMQRVIPVAEVAECPACQACPETPPLVGVWRDPITAWGGTPMDLLPDTHLDVSSITDQVFRFITAAEIVNEDWVLTGVAASPLLIDVSALWWDVTVDTFPFIDEFGNTIWCEFSYRTSGTSLLVFANGYAIGGAHCNEISATITATPVYMDVRLNTLTMNAIFACW